MPFHIRAICPADDLAVAAIIRSVMPEFGASGPGYAILDPEVDGMSAAYARPDAAYFVVTDASGRVVGAGGVAPLEGGAAGTCELRKMYLLPETRGLGAGRRLLERCLATARGLGYQTCYLETLAGMTAAQRLYERLGFRPLDAPRGAPGHHGCDRWYALELG
jgi:putative acetyltransferase